MESIEVHGVSDHAVIIDKATGEPVRVLENGRRYFVPSELAAAFFELKWAARPVRVAMDSPEGSHNET